MQGATEPLPVSSSAHLLLVRWALRWDDGPPEEARALDVALHLGTAAGTAVALRHELISLLADLRTGDARARAVVLSPLPAALLGGPFAGVVHRRFTTPGTTTALLAAAGLVAAALERHAAGGEPPREDATTPDVAAVAVAQVLALVPGVSRTTAAVCAGQMRGLSPAAATRTATLLGLPVVTAAAVRHAGAVRRSGRPGVLGALAAGVTTAATSGLVLRGRPPRLDAAAHYRLAVAGAVCLLAASRRRAPAPPAPPGRGDRG